MSENAGKIDLSELLFSQAPVGIGIYSGPRFRIDFVNDQMLEYWGREKNEVIHLPLFDALPEARGQGFEEIIENVYRTGEKYISSEIPVSLMRKGKMETIFTKLIFTPLLSATKEITGVMGMASEITEQVIARAMIEEVGQKFQNLVEDVPVGITLFRGPEFIVEMANDRYLQIVDRKKKDFVGAPLFNVLPEVKEAVESLLNNVYHNGVTHYGVEFEVILNRFNRKDVAYFNFVYQPWRERGKTIGVIVVAMEVTEQVSRKKLLENSERQFRAVVDNSPIAMTIFRGPDFIIDLANKTLLERIWRRNKDEVLGKPLLEVFPELKSQKFPELLRQVMKTGIVHGENEAPAYVNGADGMRLFYLDFEYAPLRGVGDEIVSVMVTVYDVTEKVNARIKIENAEERLRLATEAMNAGVYDMHIQSGEIIGNPRFYEIFDLPLTATVDEIMATIHPDDIPVREKASAQLAITGELYYQMRVVTTKGEVKWIVNHGRHIQDRDGGKVRLVGTIIDITDRIEAEEAMKNLAASLEQMVEKRTEDLQAANAELASKNKELMSFNYISSHDLQEPLRKIQTFASRINSTQDELSPANRQYFEKIQSSANRMQLLIRDLLEYSKASDENKNYERTDLNAQLQMVRDEVLESHPGHIINLYAEHLPEMNVIPFQFHQLFTNLLSNSLKFAKKDQPTSVHIKYNAELGENADYKEDNQMFHVITYSDEGIGFEPQYNERIFEVFQRLHSRQEYEGTGIGLAICRKIVENHKGTINAFGKQGEGATFVIKIPMELESSPAPPSYF